MGASVTELLTPGRGVAVAGADRHRRSRLDYLTRRGQLVRVLPGTYTTPELATHPVMLARAFVASCPDAVIAGKAAAALTFWPALPCVPIEIVSRRRVRSALFAVRREALPVELVDTVGGIPVTVPALTALDLCLGDLGAGAIDTVLLRTGTTLADLHQALELTAGRHGNKQRRRLLKDTATMGCSVLERRGHRVLRRAGITEWVANRRFRVGGTAIIPDIRFTRVRLVLEFDGYSFHYQREAFENDRRRDNLLQLDRFIALRFTDRSLDDEGEFVRQVRAAQRIAEPY